MVTSDDDLWADFLAFVPRAPSAGSPLELFEGFEDSLLARGLTSDEAKAERRRVLVMSNSRRDWIGPMFDRIYTSDSPNFRLAPNVFLTEVIDSIPSGRALDIAMGQGRNAVFLASIGWETTGIDVSKAGIAAAKENARRAGVKIDAREIGVEDFDLGAEAWDLIVLTYALVPGGVDAPRFANRVIDALSPGGHVVIETFGSERGAENRRPVDVDPDDLRTALSDLEIIRFEDERTVPEWTDQPARVVRLAARKPAS
jgi:2-polyprenyl-3-methyl-5-hydroxy-6-metoxy-1,4-benzoquinol methylase